MVEEHRRDVSGGSGGADVWHDPAFGGSDEGYPVVVVAQGVRRTCAPARAGGSSVEACGCRGPLAVVVAQGAGPA